MMRLFIDLILSMSVDSFEPKTMVTRKLRRRHYEPLPMPEKRRKLAPLSSLVYVLDEHEVDDDLKVIFKVKKSSPWLPDVIRNGVYNCN